MRDDGLSDSAGGSNIVLIGGLTIGVLLVLLLMLTGYALNSRDGGLRPDPVALTARESEQTAVAARERAAQEAATAAALRERDEAADRLRARNEVLRLQLTDAATALRAELQNQQATRTVLLQRLADRLSALGVIVTLDPATGVLQLPDSVTFSAGRSTLADAAAQHDVTALGSAMADVLPCFASGGDRQGCAATDPAIIDTVLVEGYADGVPFPGMSKLRSQQENDRLSAGRALTVLGELRRQQPVLETLRNAAGQGLLGIAAYGQGRPLPDTGPDRARDRRIDLRFVLDSRTSDALQRVLDEIDSFQAGQDN